MRRYLQMNLQIPEKILVFSDPSIILPILLRFFGEMLRGFSKCLATPQSESGITHRTRGQPQPRIVSIQMFSINCTGFQALTIKLL